ncbi:MAG: hypothetical protein GWO04_09010, partial [Actinobacteria bacterium]|nr:hypothetical protein [Actinomycetota bacterium]
MGVDPDGCGGPTTLLDDFDDGVRGSLWSPIQTGSASVAETDGQLTARPGTDVSGSGYVSTFAVDMRDAWVAVRVDAVAGVDAGITTRLAALRPTNDYYLAISVTDGELTFLRSHPSEPPDATTLAFDAESHRWWRIRESGDVVHWETSPNGSAWDTHRSEPSPPWINRAHLGIGALATRAGTSPGTARFDELNYDSPFRPRQRFCPIADLVDDLTDGSDLPEWLDYGGTTCNISHGASHVRLISTTGVEADCGFVTTTAYDLRGGNVWTDVPRISNFDANLNYAFVVTDRHGEEQRMAFQNDEYVFRDAAPVSYDSLRYWRIREADGELV